MRSASSRRRLWPLIPSREASSATTSTPISSTAWRIGLRRHGESYAVFFLWLTDVNKRRAPMMYRPGSHRLVAAARSADPVLKDATPGVQGIKMVDLPPEYAAPQPVLAQAGQVTVLTTSMVHGGSTNIDDEPRKALVMTYTAAGVEIGLPENQAATKREYDAKLRELLRPERAHLVAED